jgi:hypothetical protein
MQKQPPPNPAILRDRNNLPTYTAKLRYWGGIKTNEIPPLRGGCIAKLGGGKFKQSLQT